MGLVQPTTCCLQPQQTSSQSLIVKPAESERKGTRLFLRPIDNKQYEIYMQKLIKKLMSASEIEGVLNKEEFFFHKKAEYVSTKSKLQERLLEKLQNKEDPFVKVHIEIMFGENFHHSDCFYNRTSPAVIIRQPVVRQTAMLESGAKMEGESIEVQTLTNPEDNANPMWYECFTLYFDRESLSSGQFTL